MSVRDAQNLADLVLRSGTKKRRREIYDPHSNHYARSRARNCWNARRVAAEDSVRATLRRLPVLLRVGPGAMSDLPLRRADFRYLPVHSFSRNILVLSFTAQISPPDFAYMNRDKLGGSVPNTQLAV